MTDKTEKKTDTSSANNSIAEFVKATSVAESNAEAPGEPAKQAPMDGSTEVSPMDRGAEDELDGSAPPKEGETVASKKAKAPAAAAPEESKAADSKAAEAKPKDGATEEPKGDDTAAIEEAKDVQEVGAHIGRPDSKVTSNSPEKKAEPAEHVDLEKSA
ncbi:MAG: hypothetical protein QG574_4789 [Cyanobacteriota bacterium erpe_2018_sw_21hr_WHONDRS-SW48-000092_B_bin.40]|jgi:hypothetical protein|nr:hypothetical protein [Cyanobacteriota bacterium erpe_2018_sw_21hr_WHONDRS-SW48-000092_B_bin.40]